MEHLRDVAVQADEGTAFEVVEAEEAQGDCHVQDSSGDGRVRGCGAAGGRCGERMACRS